MEEKRTLFEYLYKNLREQIMTGYLKYGDPLPSMSQLCENYHVGIRTVKDVLAALKKRGLSIPKRGVNRGVSATVRCRRNML